MLFSCTITLFFVSISNFMDYSYSCFTVIFVALNISFKGFWGNVKPDLLRHESHSLACSLRILFRMYTDDCRQDASAIVEKKLIL